MSNLLDRSAAMLLFASSVTIGATAHGADAAAAFGATRLATGPTIEIGAEQEVCRLARDALTVAFRSNVEILDAPVIMSGAFKKVEFEETTSSVNEPGARRTLAHLDLGGGSARRTILLSAHRSGEEDYDHSGQVFPLQASPEELALRYPDGVRFYPEASLVDGVKVDTGGSEVAPVLFRHKFQFYFPYGGGVGDAIRSTPTPIFQLLPSGNVQRACLISQGHAYRHVQEFSQLKDLAALLSLIQNVVDDNRNLPQNPDSMQITEMQFQLEETAAIRPWVVASYAAEVAPEAALDAELRASAAENWSLRHPRHRRQFLTLQSLVAPASRSLSRHLEKKFGMSRSAAEAGASRLIAGLIESRFNPSDWNDPEAEPFRRDPDIVRAVIVRNRARFDAYLEQIASMPESKGIYSELLRQTIEWPYAFDKLLAMGADPGRGDELGKTPLMIAAESNRPDAVRKLLAAGASVDAVRGADEWRTSPTHGKTALHYAAAHADRLVIRLLLDAGADPFRKNSKELAPKDYLSGNPRLNATSPQVLLDELQTSAAIPVRASFDCKKAREQIDRAICDSELLRMLDSEIAAPYAQLKASRGRSIAEEQKAWLSERNRRCGVPLDEDCLAETMAVRANELMLRAGESKPRS